jgi:diaminopimelate decarboxylase
VREIQKAFEGVDLLLAYSVKANGNLALLNRLAGLGTGADIVSQGELHRALKGGIPPEKILFADVGKTDEELKAGIDAGSYSFNVGSTGELNRLEALGRKRAIPVAVGLYRWAATRPHLRARGIDVHIGSQILTAAPYKQALRYILEIVSLLKKEGINLDYVDLGGGFGAAYEEEGMEASLLGRELLPLLAGRGLRLVLEPGRFLVGEAGLLLTRVHSLKVSGGKTFVITDAGMTELIRPSHYGGYHRIDSVVEDGSREEKEVDVVGPICETGDFLARGRLLPLPKPGDLLAVGTTGAYGFTMSSNYNARRRAAEVMVEGDQAHLVRERETVESPSSATCWLPHDRLRFDLDEHAGADEAADLDHGRGWEPASEGLSMGASVFFPPADIGHIHPGPDHCVQACPQLFQSPPYDLQTSLSLGVPVPGGMDVSIRIHRGCAGHVDRVPYPKCAAVSDSLFPRRATECSFEFHGLPFQPDLSGGFPRSWMMESTSSQTSFIN